MTLPPSPAGPDVLDGWKAVADYLGKSVRTAQRWNAESGLPVHKLGAGPREHVYAYRSELDEWRRSASRRVGGLNGHNGVNGDAGEAGSPDGGDRETRNGRTGEDDAEPDSAETRPSRRWRWPLIAAAAAVALAAVGIGAFVRVARGPDTGPSGAAGRLPAPSATSPNPARYLVVENRLRVFSADGTALWEHRFERDVEEVAYEGHHDPLRLPAADADTSVGELPRPVHFADVDGDGLTDVLFVARFRAELIDSRLYCFDHAGRVRWEFTPEDRLSFGGKDYGVPAFLQWVLSHRSPDGRVSLWVAAQHQVWYPAAVYRLDPAGSVVARFVSNGHVVRAAFSAGGGRERVLLGGVNNERKSGFLAVFDLDRFGSSAPAETAAYRCGGCPPAHPERYFVFPPAGVAAAFRGMPFVSQIAVAKSQEAVVSVEHGVVRLPGDPADSYANTNYSLDGAFRVRSAEYLGDYRAIHDFLFRAGRVGRPFDAIEAQSQLWPVLTWDGSRYVSITGPER